jgi:hypothetical protein
MRTSEPTSKVGNYIKNVFDTTPKYNQPAFSEAPFPKVLAQCVHTGPIRRQHQHTDCIYGHYTGLHENYNNKIILAILL